MIPLPHMTISVSTATDSSDPFKYQIDQPSPNAWRLRVQNFQLSDEANYECRVQVGDKNFIQARRHLIATGDIIFSFSNILHKQYYGYSCQC